MREPLAPNNGLPMPQTTDNRKLPLNLVVPGKRYGTMASPLRLMLQGLFRELGTWCREMSP